MENKNIKKKRKALTQEDKVLQFLQENGSITSLDAIRWFACTRLSAQIYNLRNLGYNIVTQYETSKNRFGESTTYARYVLLTKGVK